MVNTEAGEAMMTLNALLNILAEEMHWLGESGS
jgi:hypothetical protein